MNSQSNPEFGHSPESRDELGRIRKGLIRASRHLLRSSESVEASAEQVQTHAEYDYFNFRFYVQEYGADTEVAIADLLPEENESVLVTPIDKSSRLMGDQRSYWLYPGRDENGAPRLVIKKIHQWKGSLDRTFQTGKPEDVSIGYMFGRDKGIGDQFPLGTGSRVVRIKPSLDIEPDEPEAVEPLPEDSLTKAAFDALHEI